MSAISEAIETFAKTIPDNRLILDVGCGLRPYEKFFTQSTYIGIDVAKSGREAEGKEIDFEFDGINIPFEDDHFDVVICTEVLEHAINPVALLLEINRVLVSGGKLFLTVPFMWGLHELPYDFRRYTTIGIKSEIEKANFKIIVEDKLTSGIQAIQMLIASETNNYLNNVVEAKIRDSYQFKICMWIQHKLLRTLHFIWSRSVRFERVYIDNLVIAEKIKGIE